MSRLLVNKSTAFVSGSVVLLGVLSYYAKKKARRSVTRRDLKHKRGETSYNGKNFKGQIKFLLNIVLPSWRSKEAFVLAAHTGFLFTRTFLSLYVAHLDGALVKALVSRDGVGFVDLLIRWMVVAIPSSACNSMIKYLESTLATCFRARLSEYSLKHYMDNEVYYRVLNLDDRVTNADQRLTEDVSNFCTNLAHVHSQLSKPFLDVIMSSFNLIAIGGRNDLRRGAGTASTILGCIVIYVSWATLRFARPPLGALVARQAALEGRLRHVHARLIHNAEEIGFYRGHNVELAHLTDAFEDLRDHQTTVHMMRVPYNTLESFLMKYVWSAAGIGMLAMPAFFFENVKKGDTSELMSTRTGDVVTSRKLLLTAADAIERMLLALKEVAELAGYSSRVVEALTVFDEVGQGQYVKHVTVQNDDDFDLKLDPLNTTAMSLQSNQSTEDDDDDDDQQERAVLPLFERRGVTEIADCVAFDHVPIVTPNGDVLVRDLNFSVQPGDHLLISGPNGCGKSSLFRILGGLWPVHGGKVKKPSYSDMFYIPQQPYMTLGTLREQIIYPDTLNDMRLKGRTDDQLMDILRRTHTEHVATREVDGLDAIADWKSALSGGLLQRVGMARILYHKPKYAILDECTSAVSIDVEGSMYQYMIDIGITLLTVTHRPSLWKYHKFLLQFDGEGGYFFRKMDNDANQVLSLAAERDQVHSQLKELQTRLNKLDEEMAVVDD